MKQRFIGLAVIGSAVLALLLIVAIVLATPSWRGPVLPELTAGLQIFDRNNNLVSIMLGNRDIYPLPIDQIAKPLPDALIAAEDRAFYEHHGINLTSIARAMLADMEAGRPVQGGSTLTQQLTKNLFFPDEKRTLWIKIREAIIAVELEMKYSKQQILEAYLNYVYFGQGTYGVERAAEKYFGKPASKLTLAESAYLAGLVNAPSTLSSPEHRQEAIDRQREILSDMAKVHLASSEDVERAKHQRLAFRVSPTTRESASYFIAYVIGMLQTRYTEKQLWHEGLHVFTTLDPLAQAVADQALTRGIRKAPRGVSQGALVCINVADDQVLALVGGAGLYAKSPWDRAISAHTAGSAFKPFVYLAAIKNGVARPDTIVDDLPLTIVTPGTNQLYSPKNFDGQFMGPMSIRRALALSRNVCAVHIAQTTGIQSVISTAEAAGIHSKLDANLALALGSSAVTPLEMANAYSTFARGGIYMQPIFIRAVCTKSGQVLERCTPSEQRVFDQEQVLQLVDMLQDVVDYGTGRAAALHDRPVAGKTGTADGARDIWFIGFTPDTVAAVWGGNDTDQPVPGTAVTGGSVAAGIWKNFMQQYYAGHHLPVGQFIKPRTPFLNESELRAQLSLNQAAPNVGTAPAVGAAGLPLRAPSLSPLPPNGPGLRALMPTAHEQSDDQDSNVDRQNTKKRPGKIGRFFHKLLNAFN